MKHGGTMKLMTFNTQHCLNFVDRKIDFDIMAKAIINCDADVIGLNEMRNKGVDSVYEDQVGILAELTGIEYKYFAEAIRVKGENPYGNGILSKIPIVEVETIPIPDPPRNPEYKRHDSRCLLKAKLENGLTVLISHFGLHPDEKLNAVNTVLEHIEDEKCVLMGDFNIKPDNDLLIPIRERMVDTSDYSDGKILSFPSDVPKEKIDYIFVSHDVEVDFAYCPPIIASDHRPLVAVIKA